MTGKKASSRFLRPRTMSDVPLLVDDEQLARLLCPPSHVEKVKPYFKTFEDKHFPKRDIMLGGRPWRAAKHWLDRHWGNIGPNDEFFCPLFVPDKDLGRLVFGLERAREWRSAARYLEARQKLPIVNPIFGGRYWPAVKHYFDECRWDTDGGREVENWDTPPNRRWSPLRKRNPE